MAAEAPNAAPQEVRRCPTWLPRALGIGTAAIILIIAGFAVLDWGRALSPSERRLVGHWAFETCDSSKLPRIFEFRDNRIAILVDVRPSAGTVPSFYDWRVDGNNLVLTGYDEREVDESVLRKVRRAGYNIWGGEQAKPIRGEPIETFVILHKDSNEVDLTPPQADQASSNCTIRLSRIGQSNSFESPRH